MVDRDVRKVGLTVRMQINRLRINGVRTGTTRLRVFWADEVGDHLRPYSHELESSYPKLEPDCKRRLGRRFIVGTNQHQR